MNIDVILFSQDRKQDNWLKRCLPVEEWQKGNEEMTAILEKAETSEQVIDMVLNSDTMRGTQFYAELSKDQPDHWKRVRRDLDGWYETYSDDGSLKIGCNGFSVKIPNGYGDGRMYFVDVGKGCFNPDMLKFWTSVEGHEINVYDYDCSGGQVIKTLDGRYGVFHGYGFVVFERWGDAQ